MQEGHKAKPPPWGDVGQTSSPVEECKEITGSHSPSPAPETPTTDARDVIQDGDDDASDDSSSDTTGSTSGTVQSLTSDGTLLTSHDTSGMNKVLSNKTVEISSNQTRVYAAPGGPEVMTSMVIAVDPHPGAPPVDTDSVIAEAVKPRRKHKKKHKGVYVFMCTLRKCRFSLKVGITSA